MLRLLLCLCVLLSYGSQTSSRQLVVGSGNCLQSLLIRNGDPATVSWSDWGCPGVGTVLAISADTNGTAYAGGENGLAEVRKYDFRNWEKVSVMKNESIYTVSEFGRGWDMAESGLVLGGKYWQSIPGDAVALSIMRNGSYRVGNGLAGGFSNCGCSFAMNRLFASVYASMFFVSGAQNNAFIVFGGDFSCHSMVREPVRKSCGNSICEPDNRARGMAMFYGKGRGESWALFQELGGVAQCHDVVYDIAWLPDQEILYFAGSFESVYRADGSDETIVVNNVAQFSLFVPTAGLQPVGESTPNITGRSGPGLPGTVYSLVIGKPVTSQYVLFAGGSFRHYVAAYDGVKWHKLPGLPGSVSVLAYDADVLYALGNFSGLAYLRLQATDRMWQLVINSTNLVESNWVTMIWGPCQGNALPPDCLSCLPYYFPPGECTTLCNASVDCSDHGKCLVNGSCACDTNFVGEGCADCASGWYPKGECKSYCNTTLSCSGHGYCSLNGSCVCDYGFTGRGCDQGELIDGNTAVIVAIISGVLVSIVAIALVGQYLLKVSRQRQVMDKVNLRSRLQDRPDWSLLANVDKPEGWRNVIRKQEWVLDASSLVLDHRIGEGSFGRVWVGSWRGLAVAIKEMQCPLVDADFMYYISTELVMLQRMRHPTIIHFHGASLLSDDTLLIVTEYCSRGSLHHLLRNNTLSLAVRLQMALDIALALDYMHSSFSEPIMHRDLKTPNIFITEDFRAKVGDFGLAKQRGRGMQTMGTSCVGSAVWMAPEVIRGENYSECCDIYSFGIVLYELLSLRNPYEGIPETRVLIDVANGKLRPSIPPAGGNENWADSRAVLLVQQCWHEDSRQRPRAAYVVSELQALLSQTEVV